MCILINKGKKISHKKKRLENYFHFTKTFFSKNYYENLKNNYLILA